MQLIPLVGNARMHMARDDMDCCSDFADFVFGIHQDSRQHRSSAIHSPDIQHITMSNLLCERQQILNSYAYM